MRRSVPPPLLGWVGQLLELLEVVLDELDELELFMFGQLWVDPLLVPLVVDWLWVVVVVVLGDAVGSAALTTATPPRPSTPRASRPVTARRLAPERRGGGGGTPVISRTGIS